MNSNLIPLLNPDDLDVIYKGIQQKVEGKVNNLASMIPIMMEKYQQIQLQDSDKKLLNRFQFRLQELLEKCKNQEHYDYIISLQQTLGTLNFFLFLQKITQRLQSEIQVRDTSPVKQAPSNWQVNHKNNKNLYQFYKDQFWDLYGILLLNEEYIESLILYYQSKKENVERLYKSSLERNAQFHYIQNQRYPEQSTLEKLSLQMKFSQMTNTLDNMYKNGQDTLNQDRKSSYYAHSFSPKKNLRASAYKRSTRDITIFQQFEKPQRGRNYSQHNTNYCPFSNQTLIEKSQLINQSPVLEKPKTASTHKKINSIDLNEYFNKFMQTPSITPKRGYSKPKVYQNMNSTFYQQLFPSSRTNHRALGIMKNILFNESKGFRHFSSDKQ